MKIAAISLSTRSFARHFDPDGVELMAGDFCVVEDKQIKEAVGRVELIESHSNWRARTMQLPKVLRIAAEKDVEQWRGLKQREDEAITLCKEKVRELKLEMKIANVRFDDRQRRVIFQFTADQRVDFRQLVRELASKLRARIELWQIGVRDEARCLDGFGICGQRLCCSGWIREFSPVSIRQAKDQDLVLSPAKLSGLCGRLRCCLTYEHKHYKETSKRMPQVGRLCRCKGGDMVVVTERNFLTDEVTIRDGGERPRRIPLSDIEEVLGKAKPGDLSAARPERRSFSGRQRDERPRSSRSSGKASEPNALGQKELEDAPAPPTPPRHSERDSKSTDENQPRSKGGKRRRRSRGKRSEGTPSASSSVVKSSQDAAKRSSKASGQSQTKPVDGAKGADGGQKPSRRRRRPRRRRKPSDGPKGDSSKDS